MQNYQYSENFFKNQRDMSRSSAQVIIPMLLELVQPRSVVDVGCGVGGWLAVFREQGIEDIRGVDGAYVNKDLLFIPKEAFTEYDLRQPFTADRQYDLVISLEVAEHLPPEAAETFVQTLTGLGPVVLFSAAVPYQAGVNHLNEQWQDYWAGLFRQQGYLPIDTLRRQVWSNENVAFWYAQNMLLYVREDYLQQHSALLRAYEQTSPEQLAILHPKMLTDIGVARWFMFFKRLPFTLQRALKKRLNRRAG